ncbi:hypothetical protein Rhow_000937 [Rhodococcus wratislaviensis]|uniref:Uncharacterized protein n=1 Tax=Rhodococcus wratislaviensis TaxID=44752 RepID=A0A402CMX7_RHOWR|nr:hypothetical protein Rhow_000937 [Rhodococcus wratislaviensis]
MRVGIDQSRHDRGAPHVHDCGVGVLPLAGPLGSDTYDPLPFDHDLGEIRLCPRPIDQPCVAKLDRHDFLLLSLGESRIGEAQRQGPDRIVRSTSRGIGRPSRVAFGERNATTAQSS